MSAASKKRIVRNNFSIAGVGYLRYEDRDAIPQAADFLMTEENVHTAVVYGIVRGEDGSEMVTGSLRTNKLTLDPDEFLKEAFGQDPTGATLGAGGTEQAALKLLLGFYRGLTITASMPSKSGMFLIPKFAKSWLGW